MGGNRHAHPNESSVGCVFCVPEVICAEVSAVKSTRCPLCLPKLHAEVVRLKGRIAGGSPNWLKTLPGEGLRPPVTHTWGGGQTSST